MIRIRNQCSGYTPPLELLSKVMNGAVTARFSGCTDFEIAVDLLLVDDEAISLMNHEFKGREGPTDVLSWPDGTPDPDEGEYHLGDIAISLTTAQREADLRGIEIDHEVILYALHGVLHLLGLKDSSDDERLLMRSAEREELNRWGLTAHWEEE